MSLQLPSEMELIDEGMSKSKAYQISMLSILAAIMFLMKSLCFFIPIPVGLFALYFFRDFGEVVVKALYLKNVLLFLVVLMFSSELIHLLFLVLLTLSDMGMGMVVIQDGFSFYNRTILKVSMITQIPVAVISTLVIGPSLVIGLGLEMPNVILYLFAAVLASGFGCIITGVTTLIGFKLILRIMKMIPNMITINKEHVGF